MSRATVRLTKLPFYSFRQGLCALSILIIASTAGCGIDGGKGDDDQPPPPSSETDFTLSAATNESGFATVSFTVAEGSTKFGVSVSDSDGTLLRFIEIVSGGGTNYLDPGRQEVSFAGSLAPFVKAASIPSRASDPSITSDARFTVTAESTDNFSDSIPGQEVSFRITSKVDNSLSSGTLPVNLFFVGEVGQDESTRIIVRAAIDEFRRIYSSAASISLAITEIDLDGGVTIPSPLNGDGFYTNASASAGSPAVNIFIGGDIEATSGNVLGIASDIPGPPHPSPRSGVAVSFFTGAGPDGRFSDEEIRLLGETMAHESGHYLGLFHPVDFSGSSVNGTDPLDDTPTCSFITECLNDDSLISNLMFLSPVSGPDGDFIPQNQLTLDQRGVLNRYIAVD